jgi:hypothetical protein
MKKELGLAIFSRPSFETHRCAMLLRMRSFSPVKLLILMVRSVAPRRNFDTERHQLSAARLEP